MSIGIKTAARLDLVALDTPLTTVPDGEGGYVQTGGPLDPPQMWGDVTQASPTDLAAGGQGGTVFATATHRVRLPFHPTVTTYARITWSDRAGRPHIANVLGVTHNADCSETQLVVEETQ